MLTKNLAVKNVYGIINNCRFTSFIPKGRLDGKVAVVTASTDGYV